MRASSVALALLVSLIAAGSCGGRPDAPPAGHDSAASIRITGSDTMVNLVQAFAESYRGVRPDVSIQVTGGGSGVGIAGLIEGILEIAAAGRSITAQERAAAHARHGTDPREFVVAVDALAVYVHPSNPVGRFALGELAEIYGEGGTMVRWSQLGIANPLCPSDKVVRWPCRITSSRFRAGRRHHRRSSRGQAGAGSEVTVPGFQEVPA